MGKMKATRPRRIASIYFICKYFMCCSFSSVRQSRLWYISKQDFYSPDNKTTWLLASWWTIRLSHFFLWWHTHFFIRCDFGRDLIFSFASSPLDKYLKGIGGLSGRHSVLLHKKKWGELMKLARKIISIYLLILLNFQTWIW